MLYERIVGPADLGKVRPAVFVAFDQSCGLYQLKNAVVVKVFEFRIPGPGAVGHSGVVRAINPRCHAIGNAIHLARAGP